MDVKHEFVDENGDPAYIGPTRLGSDHEVVKTTVSWTLSEIPGGDVTFTHTVARPKFDPDS